MTERTVSDANPVAGLLYFIYRARFGVAVIFVLGLAGALAAAMLTRPVYRSQVVLTVATEQPGGAGAGLSSLVGQFGGLASLAGVNLSAGAGLNRNEAVAVLSSQELTRHFLESQNLLPVLFEKRWDNENQRWRETDPAKIPTVGDGVEAFQERVRRITMDERTGIVTLSVDWHDREVAANWANALVAAGNEELRQRAIAEASRSLEYLETEAQKTSVTEVREAIYGLVESQIKTIMLANVRDEYAFKVLDPAIASDEDKYVWPRPVLIVGVGVIFSAVLSIGWALARAIARKLRADFVESIKLR